MSQMHLFFRLKYSQRASRPRSQPVLNRNRSIVLLTLVDWLSRSRYSMDLMSRRSCTCATACMSLLALRGQIILQWAFPIKQADNRGDSTLLCKVLPRKLERPIPQRRNDGPYYNELFFMPPTKCPMFAYHSHLTSFVVCFNPTALVVAFMVAVRSSMLAPSYQLTYPNRTNKMSPVSNTTPPWNFAHASR